MNELTVKENMVRKTSNNLRVNTRTLIIVLQVLIFFSACLTVYFVHKHHPLQSVDSSDYDPSCYWIKTDKAKQETSCSQLYMCILLGSLYADCILIIMGHLNHALYPCNPPKTICFHSPRSPPPFLRFF
jgi:hypothetical protein